MGTIKAIKVVFEDGVKIFANSIDEALAAIEGHQDVAPQPTPEPEPEAPAEGEAPSA